MGQAVFDALRNPAAPPLRPDLLASGAMIDLPQRRRPTWPHRAMRLTVRGFWIAMALVLAARVAWEALR